MAIENECKLVFLQTTNYLIIELVAIAEVKLDTNKEFNYLLCIPLLTCTLSEC